MVNTKLRNIVLLCVACTMLSSCVSNKQGVGTGVGALAGGLLGSQFGKGSGQLLAVGIGAIAGGFVGSAIGKNMDEHDQLMAERASQKALEVAPSGSSVAWRNPDNGHSGVIVPTRTYKHDDGRYCREYSHTINIGGQHEKAYGKACRQPDGQWQIVN